MKGIIKSISKLLASIKPEESLNDKLLTGKGERKL